MIESLVRIKHDKTIEPQRGLTTAGRKGNRSLECLLALTAALRKEQIMQFTVTYVSKPHMPLHGIDLAPQVNFVVHHFLRQSTMHANHLQEGLHLQESNFAQQA